MKTPRIEISIKGPSGSGKTTASRIIREALRNEGWLLIDYTHAPETITAAMSERVAKQLTTKPV